MSSEKTDAIVIRQADFSESSRVMTLFTRDFGKISALAKGAKRLRSSFESGFDLLSQCHVVFLRKSQGTLDLLTESQLIRRFQPRANSLPHLYSGYYVAELLNALTEDSDPHPELFQSAVMTLENLGGEASPFVPVTWFELATLSEIGQLPDFYTCGICQTESTESQTARFWVSQSGLICSNCGHSEYQASELATGSLQLLHRFHEESVTELLKIPVTPTQKKDLRRVMTAAVSHVLGRRPKTLPLITM